MDYAAILLLVLLCFGPPGAQGLPGAGRALMARRIDEPVEGDAAVELKMEDFNTTLSGTPSTWTIVEFFAHWCPACRNYKPHYEKLQGFSMDVMLRILGRPSKFAFGSWEPNADSGIEPIANVRTAELLLKWINNKIGKSFSLDDEKFENESPANTSDPIEVARAIYDIEEATANIFDIFVDNKVINSDSRASFIRFLQVLAVHHPSKRCRRGTLEILVNFDELWPSDPWSNDSKHGGLLREKEAFRNLHVCGKEVPRGYWIFCRGSKNDTRGFSCGLWILFHSLSVRIEDGESMATFTAICDFVHNFFICEECRQHFFKMCSRVQEPLKSRAEFVLWLWRSHNEVNERLMIEEADLRTGDPKFPKMIWPPKNLCASCRLSTKKHNSTHIDVNWNHTAVYQFLLDFYGRNIKLPLQDSDPSKSTKHQSNIGEDIGPSNAVTVPVGAAVAIAIASCGFGAVACFWRMQQKKRKYLNQFYSFKHI